MPRRYLSIRAGIPCLASYMPARTVSIPVCRRSMSVAALPPWDAYWQDTYKVKDNFTLNYGVRYEYPSAIHQVRNQATNFITGVGPVLLGSNKVLAIDTTKTGPSSFFFTQAPFTLSDTGVNPDRNNVAPVLGFAYTPRFTKFVFGNDSTVIRGGFFVGYQEDFNNIPANIALNAPFKLTTT